MPNTRVIVLNGVGSVGKTSTARELQKITVAPFLNIAMDQFIEMAPARMFGAADGLSFETGEDQGRPSTAISTGPAFERLMAGMRHAIAAMAAMGNDIVVDDVFWNGEEQDYRRLLAPYDLRLVGLYAPLELIEERERARGDRAIGLGRWQFGRVHQGVTYDLEVDMSAITPAKAAIIIRDAFNL